MKPLFSTYLKRRWPWLGLAVLGLLTWQAYQPGLSGGFLFDDFVNLDALGNKGPINDWPGFWRYLTSGTADPTGRPLALLSFLIDAHDWPAEPAPFLRTNLCLHLVNGALLFALLRRLDQVVDVGKRSNGGVALLAAGLWLLHPLFVSTTLYIVQREAMLPATFILCGLLAFTHGRCKYNSTDGKQGIGWMVMGVGLGTLLAFLSKANGILLPLLAWTLEATVFSLRDASLSAAAKRSYKRIKFLLLILPSLLAFAYIGSYLAHYDQRIGDRTWTIGQRLLTEPRVLLDYLNLLAMPRSVSTGLYNDNYLVSLNLWHPISTAPALLAVSGLIFLGFRLKRRFPSAAAALLFFFAAHLIESSAVPLELYYEHRNYVPGLLLFWPLARALFGWDIAKPARLTVAFALLGLFAITTHQRAKLWGQPALLAKLWAMQNPSSSRAQATAAIQETVSNPKGALDRLAPLWRRHPHDLQIALNYINAACAWDGLDASERRALVRALEHTDKGGYLLYQWMSAAIEIAASGDCPGLTLAEAEAWVDAALRNPAINSNKMDRRNMASLLAQIALHKRRPDMALRYFDRALLAFVGPEIAARQAAMLASSGYFQHALSHLDTYEKNKRFVDKPGFGMPYIHNWILERQDYWPREMAIFREKLQSEINAQPIEPAVDSKANDDLLIGNYRTNESAI